MMVGGSRQDTLDPNFVLLGIRQQGVPIILGRNWYNNILHNVPIGIEATEYLQFNVDDLACWFYDRYGNSSNTVQRQSPCCHMVRLNGLIKSVSM
ncbi:unnamed protein product [Schistosoma margrebowiei]|uniref:Uncharacterized protein n=1 Tax=Schistosoma margrebowiei TaxID=48269 RepID=A0A183LKH6_9TREM|nr:unnamed protein product [Schistosoma margrebowiei]